MILILVLLIFQFPCVFNQRSDNIEFLRADKIAQDATLNQRLESLLNICQFSSNINVFNYGLCFDYCEDHVDCYGLHLTSNYTQCSLCLRSDEIAQNYGNVDLTRMFIVTRYLTARTCADFLPLSTSDGVYSIDPDGQGPFHVYCELNPNRFDGTTQAGWTVFQRRVDATVDFYRNWEEYKVGFGDINGNYWMGLENLHRLTATAAVHLNVYLETFDNDSAYALYNQFAITNEYTNYRLGVSGYSGTAGDSMFVHNYHSFTTYDRDNDPEPSGNCAQLFHGAWWYSVCHEANLNGQYLAGPNSTYGSGINWKQYTGYCYSLKTSVMKIKLADTA